VQRHSGDHVYPLLPDPEVFDACAKQFAEIAKLGLDVVNAMPGSAFDSFPLVEPSTLL
jgi:hypothetical protein